MRPLRSIRPEYVVYRYVVLMESRMSLFWFSWSSNYFEAIFFVFQKSKQPLQKLGLKNQKVPNEELKKSLNEGQSTTAAAPIKKEPLGSTTADGNVVQKPVPTQTRKRTRSCSARKAAVPPSKRASTLSVSFTVISFTGTI